MRTLWLVAICAIGARERCHGFAGDSLMPLPLSIPINIDQKLYALLQEILRRSVDGTVVPLFVDYSGQRVLIGAISASSANQGKLEVTGDIKIIGNATNGLLMSAASGNLWRLTIEEATGDDGSTFATPRLTRVS